MTLRSRLHDELTASIRAAEPFRRDVLRMAYNALYNAEKRQSGRIPTANPEWWNKAVRAFDILGEPDKPQR